MGRVVFGVLKQFMSNCQVCWTHNDEQLAAARASRGEARKNHEKPIITQIVKLKKFYPAEDYHQDYVRLNPRNSYVRNIAYKKLDKLGLKRP